MFLLFRQSSGVVSSAIALPSLFLASRRRHAIQALWGHLLGFPHKGLNEFGFIFWHLASRMEWYCSLMRFVRLAIRGFLASWYGCSYMQFDDNKLVLRTTNGGWIVVEHKKKEKTFEQVTQKREVPQTRKRGSNGQLIPTSWRKAYKMRMEAHQNYINQFWLWSTIDVNRRRRTSTILIQN